MTAYIHNKGPIRDLQLPIKSSNICNCFDSYNSFESYNSFDSWGAYVALEGPPNCPQEQEIGGQ